MTVPIVRMLIPDPELYDRWEVAANGADLTFQLTHFPVKAASYKVYVAGVLKTDIVHYILDLECGVLTFVAAPAVGAAVVCTYKHSILSDTSLQTMITIEVEDILAVALALETIACNEALVQKATRLLDITTNGPAVAAALMARAKKIRDDYALALANEVAFDWAEMAVTDFARREIIENEALREG